MTKAVIFDCYGVLYVDSHLSLAQRYPELSQEIRDLGRQSDHGWIDKEAYLTGLSRVTGESTIFLEDFINSEHRLNQELVERITQLKPAYKIGMLSNVGRGWLEDFFTKYDIKSLFDAVVLSGEEGVTKPSPEIYQICADRLGVDTADCVMIDDIADNISGADAAGMKGILFENNTDCLAKLDSLLNLS